MILCGIMILELSCINLEQRNRNFWIQIIKICIDSSKYSADGHLTDIRYGYKVEEDAYEIVNKHKTKRTGENTNRRERRRSMKIFHQT